MDAAILDRLTAALADRYQIEREIGRGGMATVFLAADLKHQRRVALKVLHPELGAVLGADRFLGEIRTTANLQHPNILPLFDSGTAEGLVYYVMPFVEGESLRDRLEREGQLPIPDAVRLAQGIAAALDYAHRHGVIHRDIKPENILLQDGQALVADFGVALAVSNAGGQRITQTGISVGTPAYMSPEQAAAERQIDGRSDQYSLAAIVYEMLAGEAPFTGPTVAAIMTRMMTEAPKPLDGRRSSVPDYISAAVQRAMEKVPADRFATAAEFATALERPGTGTYRRATAAAPVRRWQWAAFAVVLVAAVGATWTLARPRARAVAPTVRFDVPPPTGVEFDRMGTIDVTEIAVSPDGHWLVYIGRPKLGVESRLYLHDLTRNTAVEIDGSLRSTAPTFSPSSAALAYVREDGAIIRYELANGNRSTIWEGNRAAGNLAWPTEDVIVFSVETVRQGLSRVTISTGEVSPLTDVTADIGSDRSAVAAPDGKGIYFIRLTGDVTYSRIGYVALAGGAPILAPGHGAQFLGGVGGDTVYFVRADGGLRTTLFDRAKGTTTKPDVIADSVPVGVNTASFARARSGVLAYMRGRTTNELVTVDLRGAALPLSSERRAFQHPRISPDGKRIAFDAPSAEGGDIWIYELAARTFLRFTTSGFNERVEWSRDGSTLFFSSAQALQQDGRYGAYSRRVDGSGPATLLIGANRSIREVVPAPDGKSIVFREDVPEGVRDIYLLALTPGAKPVPLAATPANEYMPRISPDGRWLAYASNESGREEIYVRPLANATGRIIVSEAGGREPMWSRDGTHLYYRKENQMIAATLAFAPTLAVTSRVTLFEGNFVAGLFHAAYDVAPDGKSFVMLRAQSDERRLTVVLNWRPAGSGAK